jgi:hypothetical protein
MFQQPPELSELRKKIRVSNGWHKVTSKSTIPSGVTEESQSHMNHNNDDFCLRYDLKSGDHFLVVSDNGVRFSNLDRFCYSLTHYVPVLEYINSKDVIKYVIANRWLVYDPNFLVQNIEQFILNFNTQFYIRGV